MVKSIPTLIGSLLISSITLAQPELQQMSVYGGGGDELGLSLIQTSDGGYLLSGTTDALDDNLQNVYLVRVDADGRVIWERLFGGQDNDGCYDVIETADGAFIAAGYTYSYGAGYCDGWLLKLDANGELIWSRTYGGDLPDYFLRVLELQDGELALSGVNSSVRRQWEDYWFMRVTADGDSICSGIYGGTATDYNNFGFIQTSDNGFALVGDSYSYRMGNSTLLVKINTDGDSLWAQNYGGNGMCYGNSLCQTEDGGFAVSGMTAMGAGNGDFWLMKTDAEGDSLWSKAYGGYALDAGASILPSSLGGFILVGYTYSVGYNDIQALVVETDPHGDMIWSQNYGTEYQENVNRAVRTADGGLALVGSQLSAGNRWQVVLTKIAPLVTEVIAVPLHSQWNIISSVCPPPASAMPDIWQDVVERGNLIIAKDQHGKFYQPEWEFSNMDEWNVHQGYWAKIAEDDTLLIYGLPVADEEPIPLRERWNIVAYYPEMNLEPMTALANLGENLQIAKDEEGRFFANIIEPFSNMAELQRGRGYLVRVAEADTLIWNIQQYEGMVGRTGTSLQTICSVEPTHFSPSKLTGSNMSLLLTPSIQTGGEVGVFTDAGLCVGAVSLIGSASDLRVGVAVWGDDPTTPEIDGAIEGDALTLRYWNGASEQVLEPDWIIGAGRYAADGFASSRIAVSASILTPRILSLISYPNPFNSSMTISYSLPKPGRYAVDVMDLNGRIVTRLAGGWQSAGSYRTIWNSGSTAAGVYIVKIETPSFSSTSKVTLVK